MKIFVKTTFAFFLCGLFMTAGAVFGLRAGILPISTLIALPAIAGLAGYGVSKLLFMPLERLNQSAEIASHGDPDHHFGVRTKDEIGQLSHAMERMIEDLKKAGTAVDALHEETAHHQETERELREREEYYRRLFEYSNDAVFIYDFDGRILDVNNKTCGMLGYPREELLKIPFLELQKETELSRSKAAFKTSAKTGSLRFESIFRKKDDSFIHVEISSSIVDVKKGIMQSIVSNITERKKIEKNLRESEEKFRTFMETASDLMFITDAAGLFTYVNEAMLHVLGYSKEEMLSMPFAEILDRDNLEYAKMKRRQFVEWGEDIHQLVWETKTRKKIFGEMKASGIYDGEGHFQGIRGVFRDVTERKKVEESQRLAELGKLASDMAHEVNNQVAIIASRASIALMRNPENKDIEKDLKIIADQCDEVKDIVKRLLLFSKPSKGDLKIVDILEPLNLVVNLVEDQFLKHNVNIVKKTKSPLPPVRMDEKQIQEVFMNLLRNAFEAMPDGGTISITATQTDDTVQIDVTDTGTGISKSDLSRIFDPFFTTKENGTGLGLSVCYGIIQAHKGNLKYSSKPGEGTTASVVLPMAS
jgi:two-component system, sporulation sensor kinase E